jgi:hypothetical protein
MKFGGPVLLLVTLGACSAQHLPPAIPSGIVPASTSALVEATFPLGYFCPMHPDVTSDGAGNCRKCGMTLVAGDPFDTREYNVDFETNPGAVKAGAPFTMTFKVFHPGTGNEIKDYELVHERPYHLFVVSQNMDHFAHIHPEQRPDGSWATDVTLPKPGYYKLFSDFVPTGGNPQIIPRPLVTSDFAGDVLSQSAQLVPNTEFRATVDGITAEVGFEPAHLIEGRYGHLVFKLTDEKTGRPVTDLQPYLGAFGHTLILSGDLLDYVHSHPSEGPSSDISKGLGGPDVTFEGYMPRSGSYRSWTQILRNNKLTTISFTFRVFTLAEAMTASVQR